jgi:hypothetical protein
MLNEPPKSELHLIFSSIITEKRRIIHKGSENLENRNRIEIFLSMLENLKLLPIETAEFYLEFDETTQWGEGLVVDSIQDASFKSKILESRLEYFKDWQNACNSPLVTNSKKLIFFANDDHNFIPNNLDELKRILKVHIDVTEMFKDKQIFVPLSHFPESHAMVPVSRACGTLIEHNEDFLVPVVIPIGAIVMNSKDFIGWFENDFTSGFRFVGPENPWGPSVRISNGLYLIPKFELFRHFDGYSHIGLEGWPFQVMDSEIKTSRIPPSVTRNERWETWTNINREKKNDSSLYLEDTKIAGDKNGFAASILKSNPIRLSIKSIKSLNSIYKINKLQQVEVVLKLLINSSLFRKSFSRFIPEQFIFFILKILFRTNAFRNFMHTNHVYYAILLNGASHGYLRYFRILAWDKTKNLWSKKTKQS